VAKRIGYWVLTVLMALWLVPSGILDLAGFPAFIQILTQLGYPTYVAYVLGTGKLLGVAAILYPRTRLLREWAYAGITFDLIGAIVSHAASHDPVPNALAPVLVLAFATGSYLLRPDEYKLRAA
jgi:uncharacterized membrane protein YphA (DoxX/SURF4 family)